jgi:hypothetical protein
MEAQAGFKALTLPAPTATENVTLFYAARKLTVQSIRAVVRGASPSVTYTIRYGADRSGTGTEVKTGGSTVTSATSGDNVTTFDSATIPAGNWVWLRTTAKSGTVDEMNVTITF